MMDPRRRLFLAATAAFLVALVALALLKGDPGLLLFALPALAAVATPARLSHDAAAWGLRLGVYGLALVLAVLWPGAETDGLIDPRRMRLLAAFCAAEFVTQAWRRCPAPVALLLLPCGVFLAAANTYGDPRVRLVAPVFALCLLLGLPGYRARLPRRGWGTRLAGWLALGLALGLGYLANALVARESLAITAWAERLVGFHLAQTAGIPLEPHLGSASGLRGSPERVLRLTDYRGDGYLRVCAFDHYARGRWFPSIDERPPELLGLHELRAGAPGAAVTVEELADMGGLLVTTLDTAGLRTEVPITGSLRLGGPLRREEAGRARYAVIQTAAAERLWPAPDLAVRARLLEMPDDVDPAVRQLAARIGRGAVGDQAKIDAVTAYLMTHHRYSLTTDPGTGDPVSAFLLQRKDAHCEYFAAAATILLRGLGAPTRYVVGYLAHEGAGEGTYIIRRRDAHAWAECWVAGRGWVTVDATPGGGRPDGSTEQRPSWWLRLIELAQDSLATVRDWVAGRTPGQLLLLLAAVLLPYFLWQLLRARRSRATRRAQPGDYTSDRELAALAARFQSWLSRHGHPCPPARPWHEHLAQFDAPPAAHAFARAYTAARFGPRADHTLAELETLLSAVERS